MSVARRMVCILAAPALAGLLAGCTSYRVGSTMISVRKPVPTPADVRFRIAELNLVTPTNIAPGTLTQFGSITVTPGEVRSRLSARAIARYPGTFSEDVSAIPLQVTILHTGNRNDVGGEACVSCLTLTVLPMRTVDRNEYRVELKSEHPALAKALAQPTSFSRIDTGWMSLLPTGWIPVPGGTGRRAWGIDSAHVKAGEVMIESCVEAMAATLRTVPPEDWPKVLPPAAPAAPKK